MGIGTDSPTQPLHVNGRAVGTQGFERLSDARCKEDVAPIEDALSTVQGLRGVRFRWRADACAGLDVGEGPQVGFLAQEVAEVLPEAVRHDGGDRYTLDADALVPVLVEAVKAMARRLDAMEGERGTPRTGPDVLPPSRC